MNKQLREVTVIYYCDDSLELHHQVCHFEQSKLGRVILPDAYKEDKSVIAVCDGDINILNKIGDRILPSAMIEFENENKAKKSNKTKKTS